MRRRVVIAAAVAAGLVAAVVVLEVAVPAWRERADARRNDLVPEGARLESVVVVQPGEELDLRPRSERLPEDRESTWVVKSRRAGREYRADARAVGILERVLHEARVVSDVEPPAGALERDEYGIEERALSMTITWSMLGDGATRERTLDLDLGKVTTDERHIHALLRPAAGASERLVVLSRAVLEVAEQGLDHYRAKRVLALDPQRVSRIVVERPASPEADRLGALEATPSRIVLRRRAAPRHGWVLEEPLRDEANTPRVEGLLSRTSLLLAGGYGPDEPSAGDLATLGLDPPAVTLRVELEAGPNATPAESSHVIAYGHEVVGGDAWARVDDGPLARLRGDVRRDLLLDVAFWRDNRMVRLPPWGLQNLRLQKGSAERTLEVEIQREGDGAWSLVKPGHLELRAAEAQALLDALDGVRCGRFEDELVAAGTLDDHFDFMAPGSFRLRGSALLEDGTPLRVDVDATPFTHEGTPYFAVRSTDEAGGTFACVVSTKSVDELLAGARELAGRATPP